MKRIKHYKNRKTAYINAVILDGNRGMKPRRAGAVIVEDGIITDILPGSYSIPAGCEVVDLHGNYLMPGLINLHVHLNSGGKPSAKKKKTEDYVRMVSLAMSNPLTMTAVRERSRRYAVTALRSGVTTIRTVGGIGAIDAQIRDSVGSRSRILPRILAGNTGISVPGGHVAGSLAYPVSSEIDAVYTVRRIAKSNPDLIKLMITGGIMDAERKGDPGVLRMKPEIIRAACNEAHRLGYPVAAHVESTEGVLQALRGGVDTIEHGAMPTNEIMDLFHSKGASLITTISPVLPLAMLDPGKTHVRSMDKYNAMIVLRGIVECSRRALREGIPVGLGTDTGCPFVTHYNMWRELQYFVNFCDVSNSFALYTATLRNAEIAGISDETGSIQVGKTADFLITGNNPLEDLRALKDPKTVVRGGIRIEEPKNRKDKEIEGALDDLMGISYADLKKIRCQEISV